MLQLFQDALAAYKVSMHESANTALKQEAHHRVNRILYRKLKEYDSCEISIKNYLDLYPDGKWREHQLFFLASLLKSRNRMPEYHATMHTFVTEFPDACVSVLYRQKYAERASTGN